MEKVKVSILKNQDPYEGVRKVIEMLDYHNMNIKDSRVLVKPNLASAIPPEEGAQVTHPDVVGAIIRYLYEEGARKVYVGDEPSWGLGARFCFEKTGIKKVVEKEGGELVYFDESKRITKKIPEGRIFGSLSVPAILDEVDLLINVPKMKTSLQTLVTLCIKNLFGLMLFRDRKLFHRGIDLSYVLIDIAKIIRPHLNVIDGIMASEGMGAHSGTPYPLGILMASRDMVAADIVGTQIMGFNPMEPVPNQLAIKDKIGIESIEQIEIVGEPLEEVRTNMMRPVFRLVHPEANVEVIPGGICQGCISRIPQIPPFVDKKKQYAVIMGKRVRFPKNREFDEIWCFGDCGVEEGKKLVAKFPHLKERMKQVKGCPPLDWWRDHTVEKELKEKRRV